MYWFCHLGVITELNGWDSFNPGHLDQHLLPFYERGLADGDDRDNGKRDGDDRRARARPGAGDWGDTSERTAAVA